MEYPFSIEYTVSKDRFQSLQDSVNDECLRSDTFIASHALGIEYYVSVFPNGDNDERRGETWIFLRLKLGTAKKVEASFTFSIESAEWSRTFEFVYNEDTGYGTSCCDVDEVLDPSEDFFVDEKLIIKVEGILKAEKDSNWKCPMDYRALWQIGYEDFTLVAEKKEIKVHKCVLAAHSTVFSAMFKAGMKETVENCVDIPDFTYETVASAILLCYNGCCIPQTSSIDSILSIFMFADKYDMKVLMEGVEVYLRGKLSVTNICEVAKCAIQVDSLTIRHICIDFLVSCLAKKEFVPNMGSLDSQFINEVFLNFSCRKSQTL